MSINSLVRHQDFKKILASFKWYYCKGADVCPKGENKYSEWVKALGLDETKPYGQSQEAFKWARDMISLAKEDDENRYYKVLVGFPLESMNGNVYTEAELKEAAGTLKGVVPNLNHWGDVKLKGCEFVDAAYEDGAVEAVLKVPKALVCPECGRDKKFYEYIDEKHIFNVSLEASCKTNDKRGCAGMRFTGCALLTVDTLPGIPLARIFPMESLIDEYVKKEAQARADPKLSVKVVLTNKNAGESPSQPGTTPSGDEKEEGWGDSTFPDSSFAWVPPEAKGADGNKSLRKLPYKTADGKVDLPHVRNALARLDQTQGIPDGEKERIRRLLQGLLARDNPDYAPSESVEASLRISDLELKNFKAEQKSRSLEEQVLNAEAKYKAELVKTIEQAGQLKGLQDTIKKLENTVSERDKAIFLKSQEVLEAQKATQDAIAESRDKVLEAKGEVQSALISAKAKIDEASKHLEEAAAVRDTYKTQMEQHRARADELDKKYQEVMDSNLTLTKSLTKANEDLLAAQKKIDSLNEDIVKVKRLGKVIAKV